MRKNRENQMPLTPLWPDHRLGDELQMISRILDATEVASYGSLQF